ncbi:MAG: MiaB/RimO family radical SAM methylthiotransferase, partial [Polyangiaceae bacterium]|nr:MiaB/RimO family radical SAM methylthiotransferase [Polyangiaceae bacterium]
MPRYHVVTFGCQMNAHDSSRMAEVLTAGGYDEANSAEEADVIVLNTCSIREKAEQKLRSEVGRLGRLKQKKPELLIGVAGCVAQQEGEQLLKSLPQIDVMIGPDNIPELPALLADASIGGLPKVRTVFDVDEPSFLAAAPQPGRAGATAFVTVMKGCNERCSYCIVPYTRGPERYRPAREIIDEVQRFVDSGVREVTLLGQTVNSYRDPLGSLSPAPGAGECQWRHTRGAVARQDVTEFAALLRAIAAEVPELVRLRYTSPHPRHLPTSLIRAHQDLPVLAQHVHMPVQSGSDSQLRRMIRRYTAAEYIERVTALKEAVPGLTLSTDMIVGFPGESDEDFEDTLKLVRASGFVGIYGFKYSQRPFTPAL